MTALVIAQPHPIPANTNIYTLLDEWLALIERQVEAGELAANTRDTYQVGLRRFVEWVEGHRTLTDNLIIDWKAALLKDGLRPNTVNTWLAAVRSFFAWATAARRIPYNPAADIKGARRKGTAQRHLRETLTNSEINRVLAQPDLTTDIGKRDCAILHLMAYTAARTIELHRADLANLSTEAGRLVLYVRGKGHVEADELIVIAHSAAQNAIHTWLAKRGDEPGALFTSLSQRSRGGRLSLRSFRELIKGYYRAAGVHGQRKTAHSLRHTAISNAVRHGAPVEKAQSMARHANVSTTMIYVHETDRVEHPAEDFINYEEA